MKPLFRFAKRLLLLAACWAQAALSEAQPNWTAVQDHQDMMRQLGITELRPGRDGLNPQSPHCANYDEAKDFETDKSVDAEHVGIEGHSRYGKATLVTMAYDQRFAMAYVSSSGEGGANAAIPPGRTAQ
jgi:hypothetical protein